MDPTDSIIPVRFDPWRDPDLPAMRQPGRPYIQVVAPLSGRTLLYFEVDRCVPFDGYDAFHYPRAYEIVGALKESTSSPPSRDWKPYNPADFRYCGWMEVVAVDSACLPACGQ